MKMVEAVQMILMIMIPQLITNSIVNIITEYYILIDHNNHITLNSLIQQIIYQFLIVPIFLVL